MFCGFWPCTKTTSQQRVLKIEYIYLQFVADFKCKTAHGYRRLNSSLHIALNCIYSVCFSCFRRCCYDYYWGRSAWLESKDFRSSGDEGVVLTLMSLKVYSVIKAASAPDCIQECLPPLSSGSVCWSACWRLYAFWWWWWWFVHENGAHQCSSEIASIHKGIGSSALGFQVSVDDFELIRSYSSSVYRLPTKVRHHHPPHVDENIYINSQ